MNRASFTAILIIASVCFGTSSCAIGKAVITEHTGSAPNIELYELAVKVVEDIKTVARENSPSACTKDGAGNFLTRKQTVEFLSMPSSRVYYARRVIEGQKSYFSLHLERQDKSVDGWRFFSVSVWMENEKCMNYELGVPTID